MEESSRRKSTSSESELSDGWNWVDTVEVHGENSDAESVEVIHDEFMENPTSETESAENNSTERPPETGENVLSEENVANNVTLVEEIPFRLKEFFEAGTVSFIFITVALAVCFGMLAIEESIASARPLLWNALNPSAEQVERPRNDLTKIMSDLDSYKQENSRLIYELEKMYKAFMNKENRISKGSGEALKIRGKPDVKRKDFFNPKDFFENGLSKYFISMEITQEKENKYSNNQTYSSVYETISKLQSISTTLSNKETRNVSMDSLGFLFEDLNAITAVLKDENLKGFSEKWDNKISKFVMTLNADVEKIARKLRNHVSKSVLNIHNSFIHKFCQKNVRVLYESNLITEFEFSNKEQKSFCDKYKDQILKTMNSKKRNAPKEKKPKNACKKEKCSEKVEEKNHYEHDIKERKKKHVSLDKESMSKKMKNIPNTSDKIGREEINSKMKRENSPKVKKLKRDDNPQLQDILNDKEKKNGSMMLEKKGKLAKGEKYEKLLKNEGNKEREKYRDKNGKARRDTKENLGKPVYRKNEEGYNGFGPPVKNNEQDGKKGDGNKKKNYDYGKVEYKKKDDGPRNFRSIDFKKKAYLKGRYDSKEYINEEKQNESMGNGLWFLSMGEGRANLRSKHQKSDWMFDRAKGRVKQRDEAKWIFEGAWARRRCHDRPKSTWCMWQENMPTPLQPDHHAFR